MLESSTKIYFLQLTSLWGAEDRALQIREKMREMQPGGALEIAVADLRKADAELVQRQIEMREAKESFSEWGTDLERESFEKLFQSHAQRIRSTTDTAAKNRLLWMRFDELMQTPDT